MMGFTMSHSLADSPDFDVGARERPPLVVVRPPDFTPLALVGWVRRLVHYRDLLYTLTVHRVKVRYKQSVLGIAWAVLQPFMLMIIYTVIFSVHREDAVRRSPVRHLRVRRAASVDQLLYGIDDGHWWRGE